MPLLQERDETVRAQSRPGGNRGDEKNNNNWEGVYKPFKIGDFNYCFNFSCNTYEMMQVDWFLLLEWIETTKQVSALTSVPQRSITSSISAIASPYHLPSGYD